jgi:Mor family transcriptional regulator
MQPSDTEFFDLWMKGESVGSLAKRFNLNKTQVRRIVNRVVVKRELKSEDVCELQDEKAGEERSV